jgi:hypothetical protein
MYFPYLYGRLGECSAIADVAQGLGTPQKVIPVIEPVSDTVPALQRALDALESASAFAYVLVNPSRHKLADPTALGVWHQAMKAHIAKANVVRPTFEVRSSTSLAEVAAFFQANAHRQTAISIRTAHLAPAAIASVFPRAGAMAFLHASANPSGYSVALGSNRTVEVRDSFRTEARNADYLGQEMFTTAHLDYAADNRVGFSDYTLLPGAFSAKGGPIGAAALHMSYVDRTDKSLWVEHFVSTATGQYETDTSTKLIQAMTKLQNAVTADSQRFVQSPGLTSYQAQLAARTPTNLTNNKRQQISHHLATVASAV